jgi:hypothetical protein
MKDHALVVEKRAADGCNQLRVPEHIQAVVLPAVVADAASARYERFSDSTAELFHRGGGKFSMDVVMQHANDSSAAAAAGDAYSMAETRAMIRQLESENRCMWHPDTDMVYEI